MTRARTRERSGVCAYSAHAGLLDGLRAAPGRRLRALLRRGRGAAGGVLALPNEFVRGLVSRRYDDELRRWAASTGTAGVELVVDPTCTAA